MIVLDNYNIVATSRQRVLTCYIFHAVSLLFFSIECPDVILQTIQTQSLHNLQKGSSHNNIMTLCTKNKEQNIAIKYWLLEGIMGISLYLDDTRECKCYDKKLCIGPYSAYKLVCIAGLNNYIRTND